MQEEDAGARRRGIGDTPILKHMKFPRLKSPWARAHSIVVSSFVTVLAALLCMQQQCQAQQEFVSQPDSSVDPLKFVNWLSGPQKVTLGDFADINIPDGCRLTDVHGARMILVSINNPIPDDLLGILAPSSGKWMAILKYSPDGYVKNPDVTQIDTNAILKLVLNQVTEKSGHASIASVTWQSQPTYDATRHLLEWSLQLITPSAKIWNQTAVILARHGVFEVTVAQPDSSVRAPSLEQLVACISFKAGERYADYRSGDKAAEIDLNDLISGEKHAQTAGFFGDGFGSVVTWIYCAFALCLITAGVAFVFRRNKRRNRTHRHHRRTHIHAPVPAPVIKSKAPVNSASSNPLSITGINSTANGHAQPKPMSNNHRHGAKPFYHHRRKRIFDYPKFYTKVVRELSRRHYGPPIATNGKSNLNGHANNHGHAHSDGHAQVQPDGHAAQNEMNAHQTNKSEIAEVIDAQKSLIQEQNSILEQQTRLIEEKRRLIEEQTALLNNRSRPAVNE
jgi:uncharacterized membrane-anchored protein